MLFTGDAGRAGRGVGDERLAGGARLQVRGGAARPADDGRSLGRRPNKDRTLVQPTLGRGILAAFTTSHQSRW